MRMTCPSRKLYPGTKLVQESIGSRYCGVRDGVKAWSSHDPIESEWSWRAGGHEDLACPIFCTNLIVSVAQLIGPGIFRPI
jgi:hypothetical protein